jgi:hypothetical protein
MTAYGGLVLFQALFQALDLKARLCRCFDHLDEEGVFRDGTNLLQVIVQILLGYRHLRSRDLLAGDPMVQRVLGVTELPDVATLSRTFSGSDARSVQKVRRLSQEIVLKRLEREGWRVVTVDLDGSVLVTKGHAEGTAVGFNKAKKGARSYYPLFAWVAQTGQVLDMHHRPGNVHDSNGAVDFARSLFRTVRHRLPDARLESRSDSAFFNQDMLDMMQEEGVEFSNSVPFQRFPELKGEVLRVTAWERLNDTWSYAPSEWRPKSWSAGYRLLLLRKRRVKQRKGPLQLDLFEPRDYEYEYKVVVTNKTEHARTVLHFHNGRGSQEKGLGELKQHAALDVIPTRTLHGNQLFTFASILAHNLGRELQMRAAPPSRGTLPKRPARWVFLSLGSIRDRLLRRVGRLLYPQRRFTLRLSANPDVQALFERLLQRRPDNTKALTA